MDGKGVIMIKRDVDMKNILIIEDNRNLSNAIKIYLNDQNYSVVQSFDGNDGLDKIMKNKYDLVVLDIMLPGLDGWDILEMNRSAKKTPILVLTAKGEEYNRLKGYELGADDYMQKPFSLKELSAKIAAIIRRYKGEEYRTIKLKDGFSINNSQREIAIDGIKLELTPKEYDLLLFLLENEKKVFNREALLMKVWGNSEILDYRTVDTHIKQIRAKLGSRRDNVKTIWKIGYKFEFSDEE
ncbi:MAG: hypothetical protein PWQ77_552 [Kosmotogales bacterium]|nr:hypothetical protein [Kosmotogales bacterium]